MRIERWVPGCVLLLLSACGGGSGGPSPEPRAMDPSSGFAGLATEVRITGDNFLARPSGAQLDTRQRAWLGDVELANVTWVDVHTITATVPADLAPGTKTLRVENAYGQQGSLANAFTVLSSSLAATLTPGRRTAEVGQPVAITLTVRNGGTGEAEVTSVTPSQAGTAATCGAVSPAPPLRVGAGLSQAFSWSCTGSAAGTLAVSAAVAGTDASSGAALTVTAATAHVVVQSPAALAAVLSVDGNPGSVTVGQAFTLRLVASDPGGASASVTSLVVTPLEAGCGAPTPATPQTIAGGQSAAFIFSCAATAAGNLAPAVSVRGQDANTGALLTASTTLVPVLGVQPPTALTTAIAGTPTTTGVGQAIAVTFYVTNGASAPTATVTGVAPWSTGTGGATCTSVAVSPGTTIAAGATRSFGWSCTPAAAGDLLLGATLSYTAGGAPLGASPAVPLAVTVVP